MIIRLHHCRANNSNAGQLIVQQVPLLVRNGRSLSVLALTLLIRTTLQWLLVLCRPRVVDSVIEDGVAAASPLGLLLLTIVIPMLHIVLRVEEVEDHRLHGLLLLRMPHLLDLVVLGGLLLPLREGLHSSDLLLLAHHLEGSIAMLLVFCVATPRPKSAAILSGRRLRVGHGVALLGSGHSVVARTVDILA